jgi:anthranilate phosphoribosyltransferase
MLLERLTDRLDLSEDEAITLLGVLADPALPPAMAGALLAALRTKGVTASELRGLARGMRARAIRPVVPAGSPTVDVVGTGGDASGSLNISTGTALLVAACGVRVVKHGNRSVSSLAGSADVLESLGLRLPLDEQAAMECLAACGFTFLFAQYYHPAMRTIAPIRAALRIRTVFNILGPLSNPAAPPFNLIGAFSVDAARLIAHTLSGLEGERAFVVHGAFGWDEPTPTGPFHLFDVRAGEVSEEVRTPADYGLAQCHPRELLGGDARHNAERLRAVLAGEDRGAFADALVLGTALVLELVGRADTPRAGVELARTAVASGAALGVLTRLQDFARDRSAA